MPLPCPQPRPCATRPACIGALICAIALPFDAYAEGLPSRPAPEADTVELALPDGTLSRFVVSPSGVMPPALAARFPRLRSLTGVDAAGRRARIDIAPDGVHAVVHGPDGRWIVEPESSQARARTAAIPSRFFGSTSIGSTQVGSGSIAGENDVGEGTTAERPTLSPLSLLSPPSTGEPRMMGRLRANGSVMRTFRLAVTTTGAYTRAAGGSTEDAMAGVVRTVNRLNEIFETDLGIHFVLAENNDRLINLPGKRDAFRRRTEDLEIARHNARFTQARLGQEAFDIGHVLDARGAAGVTGAIGNVCLPYTKDMDEPGQSKAAAMSGSDNPLRDDFIIGVVAHELGHQLGAWHTFNGCMRSALDDTAVEPGSGSTIMGYSGHCGDQSLQPTSDPYFHTVSIGQISDWLASRGGRCATTQLNPSQAPWIEPESMAGVVKVPARTPFRLGAEAGFADPLATLTYTFEQVDADQSQSGDLTDTGRGPLFRSRPPTTTGEQTFPALPVLLGREPIGLGDGWPTTTRDLTFRLTVRDNLGHRSHTVTADRRVHVTDTGRPFAITSSTDDVQAGAPVTLTWDVAGTADEPILCSYVRIDVSTDGGEHFGNTPLLQDTPNTGEATFELPAGTIPTRHGRFRVMCGNDTFFAISPRDITIR